MNSLGTKLRNGEIGRTWFIIENNVQANIVFFTYFSLGHELEHLGTNTSKTLIMNTLGTNFRKII